MNQTAKMSVLLASIGNPLQYSCSDINVVSSTKPQVRLCALFNNILQKVSVIMHKRNGMEARLYE